MRGRRREGRGREEGRGEEAFLIMWPRRLSALNPPLLLCLVSSVFHFKSFNIVVTLAVLSYDTCDMQTEQHVAGPVPDYYSSVQYEGPKHW